MTIKTFWVLSEEESLRHKPAVEAHQKASTEAKNYVVERIDCDGVFITTNNSVYLGFKQKQDNLMLHKKPAHYHDGQHLYRTKAKTEWDKIIIEAEKIARSAVKFDRYCKELWPKMVISSIGNEGGSSFSLSETSFGFLSGRVVAMVPFSNSGSPDLSIIADGFTEITMTKYQDLLNEPA